MQQPVYTPLTLKPKWNARAGRRAGRSVRTLFTAIALLVPCSAGAASVAGGPVISAGGVISAGAFGGFPSAAPGSWMEIYGSNLSATTRSWAGSDFNGSAAPTSLDGVTVTVGGLPAFVSYVSPIQVNVLIDSRVAPGTAQVIVSNSVGASDPYSFTVNPLQPGLLAPPSLKINGQQYVAAFLPDGALALPVGAIPGAASRPAQPNDTVVLYGVGFGPVNPAMNAGTIVSGLTTLGTPLQFLFGATAGRLAYSGLAPGYTGLYQFNLTVPALPDNSATPFSAILGGVSGPQNLVIAIQNGPPPKPDVTPPSTPAGLVTGHSNAAQITVLWAPSTDNVGVAGYHVYRNQNLIASVTATAFTDNGLAPATPYSYQVAAFDAAGNESALTAPLQIATVDTTTAIFQVGPGTAYPKPCSALTTAPSGSLIEIDPTGDYTADTCAISANHLTIRGLNGRAKLQAGPKLSQDKAIWVIKGNGTTIENIEFSGAAVSSALGGNGAGIRQEGADLTIRSCYFHHNQDGILAGDNLLSTIVIESSEFAFNGSGSGLTHNLYINHVATFLFQFNYSHDAKVGHLYKSRAATNYILYNRLSDEAGDASYEVDLPNGGLTFVVGNLIEQSPNSQNGIILSYGEEGANVNNPIHDLFVVNNTFDNRKTTGTFVVVNSAMNTAVLANNIFFGPGAVSTGPVAKTTNLSGANPLFTNSAAFDYSLMPGSPALRGGTLPGIGDGFALAPYYEYLHPASGKVSIPDPGLDIGAPVH